jgi:deoxyribodipyrimidine photo-lyase
MEKKAWVWLRRDLRLHDHRALAEALQHHSYVELVFLFDPHILDSLPRRDARVTFLQQRLQVLNAELEPLGKSIRVVHQTPLEFFSSLPVGNGTQAVYTHRDYEPYALERDAAVEEILKAKNILFHRLRDHVLFEENEIVKDDGKPYVVYTPYSKRWKQALAEAPERLVPADSSALLPQLQDGIHPMPSLQELGFEPVETASVTPPEVRSIIDHYHETRDSPAIHGTTQLGVHLRFGTLSYRKLATYARQHNEKFLNELIWREFYQQILWHYPKVVSESFKPAYDRIPWRNNRDEFKAWCEGRTGYPIVDAGMRQLNATGWMHNRVRMVVASFLTKHLLIDWRWGEAYFAEKLLDFDLASNNGGWQWAAGCGVDAAPYFRVFNPALQQAKFDPQHTYIKQWVPEWGTPKYPAPIVEHSLARERCLATYKLALNENA